MSHLEPSETKISLDFSPMPLYSRSQMASLNGALPCSAPYLHIEQHTLQLNYKVQSPIRTVMVHP